MQQTGDSLASLTQRMRAKTEQDRQEIEALARKQFSDLSESLRQSSTAALSTTEAAIRDRLGSLEQTIASRCQTLSWAFGKKCLQALFLSLSMLLGASLGGWGVVTLLTRKVTALQGEIQNLHASKAELESIADQLEKRTWGLRLLENQDGRFIVLPPKTSARTDWTVGKQKAVKLE